ncbi:MAG: class II histone deacetylase [Actinomycetota bacterium]
MRTGLVWDERYMWWDTRHGAGFMPAGGWREPGEHAENPSTKRRFKNLIDVSGMADHLVPLAPRMATVAEVERYHTAEYVARMKELSDAGGGDAGEITPFGAGGFETALLAVGGTLTAIEKTLDGTVETAYALVRPPGHHAQKDIGRGFCMFSNAALGAFHARQGLGLDRVAVVDWDVHHGNGTQWAFYDDPSVLTISLHQDRYYPGDSGMVEEIGEGAGEGANVNVPLPAGSGVGAYVSAFERVVCPALARFKPQLLIVASGLDASIMDPLARQQMHSDGYRALTRQLLDVTASYDGHIVFTHEGGYSAAYVPFCGLAVLEEVSGHRTPVEDPFLPIFMGVGGQDLQPHQAAVIDQAAALVERVPA